jgi:hypothetical protein
MSITVELPPEVEAELIAAANGRAGVGAMVREAALVELYRRGTLSERSLSSALDIPRLAVDALLKRYGVFLEQDADEVMREAEGLTGMRADDCGR